MNNREANLASAQQHLSAALRHLARATRDNQPDDALIGILSSLADSYLALVEETKR